MRTRIPTSVTLLTPQRDQVVHYSITRSGEVNEHLEPQYPGRHTSPVADHWTIAIEMHPIQTRPALVSLVGLISSLYDQYGWNLPIRFQEDWVNPGGVPGEWVSMRTRIIERLKRIKRRRGAC